MNNNITFKCGVACEINSVGIMLNNLVIRFASFSSLNMWWCYGSIAAVVILMQILSGLLISIYEVPNLSSFTYLQIIIDNMISCISLRFSHVNFCSIVFLMMLIHIGKNIWLGSYVNSHLWKSSSVLFVLVILSAFLGYVLPWGNMSYWGATVITNLITVVPYGDIIVVYVWGGYVLNAATIGRFFSLHFIVPIIVVGLILVHLLLLHEYISSNNSLDISSVVLFDILLVKDIIVWVIIVGVYVVLIIFSQFFIDADNWSLANPSVTPEHIKPEWYFLFAYAVLRCIPNKVGGVIAFVGTIIVFLLLGINNILVILILFMVNYMLLIWLGGLDITSYYTLASQYSGILYFWFLL